MGHPIHITTGNCVSISSSSHARAYHLVGGDTCEWSALANASFVDKRKPTDTAVRHEDGCEGSYPQFGTLRVSDMDDANNDFDEDGDQAMMVINAALAPPTTDVLLRCEGNTIGEASAAGTPKYLISRSSARSTTSPTVLYIPDGKVGDVNSKNYNRCLSQFEPDILRRCFGGPCLVKGGWGGVLDAAGSTREVNNQSSSKYGVSAAATWTAMNERRKTSKVMLIGLGVAVQGDPQIGLAGNRSRTPTITSQESGEEDKETARGECSMGKERDSIGSSLLR
ncbi:hypothetical protein EV421DRAFT_1747149 [Armillaria borealis]|uniref:Uncharacterized protein n=1 Tax=Armillaria borealis TaxID=47425 RepID=A0AA39IBY1_9AGAR|nr:hypothetical protein EV421DRAFT_1747149 [Armillaria borealis]